MRKKIFTNSNSDFFLEDADSFRPWAWSIIDLHREHDWQILTKRPERIATCLPPNWSNGWDNVSLGVSIENNERVKERLGPLMKVPAKIRFVSAEPLLGPIDLKLDVYRVDWVIIGGESGNETGKHLYRPCKLEWIEDLVNQCRAAGAAVFVKQLGTHLYHELHMTDRHGGNINEFPERLRIREFPKK
jgi:protein gp37